MHDNKIKKYIYMYMYMCVYVCICVYMCVHDGYVHVQVYTRSIKCTFSVHCVR